MKAIWRGDSDPLELINGKVYEIIGDDSHGTFYNVVDETGEDFLYPAEDFEVIEGSPDDWKKQNEEDES